MHNFIKKLLNLLLMMRHIIIYIFRENFWQVNMMILHSKKNYKGRNKKKYISEISLIITSEREVLHVS